MFSEAKTLVSAIVPQLKRGEIFQALQAVTPWLGELRAPGMRLLLELCPQEDRPRLVALLRDFTDQYPQRLVALPAVIVAQPDDEFPGGDGPDARSPATGRFTLPRQAPEGVAPRDDLVFLGWLDGTFTSPVPRHELLEQPDLSIRWGQATPVVGLFEWADTARGKSMPAIEGLWLARMLCAPAVRLYLGMFEASDYLTAAEVAQAMLGGSYPHPPRTEDAHDGYFFLDESTHRRATEEGKRFRMLCGGEYSNALTGV